jgi:hypothetical protein
MQRDDENVVRVFLRGVLAIVLGLVTLFGLVFAADGARCAGLT